MLQHGRPGNRPDKHHVSLGYSSLPLPSITWAPPGDPPPPPHMLRSCVAFDITRKHYRALICVCVCVCVCVDCGCLLSWVRPPSINRYSSPATTEPGGPPELTKHAFFFAKLMRTRSRKGRKNAWKGGKRWRGSSKQPQRIYLTEGERRERESRETFWMGMQICAHETTLRLCYLSLPPYKLQYTTAGCCLSVTTTVLYYKLVAAAKPRLFAWNPLGLFHNSRETTSCVCPGVQLETACRWSRCLLRSEILKSP